MIVAIPVFGSRVAPRLDCANRFRLVTLDEGGPAATSLVDVPCGRPAERFRLLSESGAEVLICGGIDRHSLEQAGHHGIRVIDWVTGEADDALTCFVEGRLQSRVMLAPGGGCRGRWRFRRGGCRQRRARNFGPYDNPGA